jgi:hypothetical protein
VRGFTVSSLEVGVTHSTTSGQVAAAMRVVDIAKVGVVVIVLGKTDIDIGLVCIQPGCLVPRPSQAVVIIVVDAPDLVNVECCVGKWTVHDTSVWPRTICAKTELIRAPDGSLVNGSVEIKVTLFMPVWHGTSVATFLLQQLLLQMDE